MREEEGEDSRRATSPGPPRAARRRRGVAAENVDRFALTLGRPRTIYIVDAAVDATLFHLGPYVTTSAATRSPPLDTRKSCRACPPVSDVQRHSSVPSPTDHLKGTQPRGPPHHPRAQHRATPLARFIAETRLPVRKHPSATKAASTATIDQQPAPATIWPRPSLRQRTYASFSAPTTGPLR